jgi:hypothetical protein
VALSGGDALAFAPLIWEFLPRFVRASEAALFWLDTTTSLRLLGDAAGVASAEAVVVPLVPEIVGGMPWLAKGTSPDDLIGMPNTVAMLAIVSRLVAVNGLGVVVEVPGLEVLGGLLEGASRDDVEDATSDLIRAALESGADSVCVRTAPDGSLERELDSVTALVEFYGATALAVNDRRGVSSNSRCTVAVLGSEGEWPTVDKGVVLTGGDVSSWWSPVDVRRILSGRDAH